MSGTVEIPAFKLVPLTNKVRLETYLAGVVSITMYIDNPLDNMVATAQAGLTFKLADLETETYAGQKANTGNVMRKYRDKWQGGNLTITGLPENHKVTSVKVAAIK